MQSLAEEIVFHGSKHWLQKTAVSGIVAPHHQSRPREFPPAIAAHSVLMKKRPKFIDFQSAYNKQRR